MLHDPAPLGRGRFQNNLAREIGTQLIGDGYNLVSGFGLGLGEQCVVGALRALYGVPKGSDADRLIVRPFPGVEKSKQQEQNTRHREEMIARCGIIVVLAGNRVHSSGSESSPGVMEEVEIGLREGKIIIPIGATGHAAEDIWMSAIADESVSSGVDGHKELEFLGNANATNEQLMKALFRLLAKAEKARAV